MTILGVYKILLERRAEDDLSELEYSIREQVIKYILKLQVDPRLRAKKLKGLKNAWRVRVGSIRVIYEINDVKKQIEIFRIKHRGKVYQAL